MKSGSLKIGSKDKSLEDTVKKWRNEREYSSGYEQLMIKGNS